MLRDDGTPAPDAGLGDDILPLTPRPLDAQTRRALAGLTGAPEFIIPWLAHFYAPDDAALVLAAHAAATALGAVPEPTLRRAVRRAVLDELEGGDFKPASFHARFEMCAFFEGWGDVPEDLRLRLNEWELSSYIDEVGPGVEAVAAGRGAESDQADYTYLLLEEAEDLLWVQPHVYLWPCNCRAMWRNCDRPLYVCLRFGNARGLGWELTHERAVEILREADADGLMHTALLGGRHGHHGVCNCCVDCCFPLLTSKRLAAEEAWPVRRHLAVVDPGLCNGCGRCVKRCPVGAISRAAEKAVGDAVGVDGAACRGCGLCATGCASGAITMTPLPAPGDPGRNGDV